MRKNGFFAMMTRMRNITRWGLMRNNCTENLTEHSYDTAVTAHALAIIGKEKFGRDIDPGQIAAVALFHDASEIITGDMPTPIKYDNPEIKAAYKAVESVAEQKLLSMLPDDLRGEYEDIITIPDPEIHALVKAADKLSAYLKCEEEIKAGNLEFKKAKEQTYAALCSNPIPALSWFMEQFLPGFELTLDELS